MRILDLVLKDLSQVIRDKKSFLFLVIMPIVFTFFMGFALKGAVAAPDNRLPLGWVNNDTGGLISQQLHDALANSDAVRLVDLKMPVDDQVKSGKVDAVLIIPEGFSAQALDSQSVQLTLVVDELSTTGQSASEVVRGAVTRLMSSVEIARLNVELIEAQKPFASSADRTSELSAGFSTAAQSWINSALNSTQISIEKAVGKTADNRPMGGNPYNQTSPGILVQFAIFGIVTSGNILVQERKIRTLQRLITTNMKPWQIIAGHLLAMFILVLLQEVLLVIFGQFLLKVDYLRQPLGTLLVMVGLGLWVSGMGLLISVISRDESQVILLSLVAMFLFTGLGGCWFPLESTGQTFSTIAHFTPAAWAMDGFQNLIIRGLDLNSVLLPVLILLAYSLGFFVLAVWRFRASRER